MRILAVGPHPDDVEFGCGGTLLKYSQRKHDIFLLILTSGGFGGDAGIRKKEQHRAADFLGVKKLFFGGLKDTEIHCNRELILKIDEIINRIKPDVVFLNYPEDIHQDHRAVSQAGISATRYVKEVLFYEVPSSKNFEPNIFVDIKEVLNDKMKLLKLHASQVDKTKVENLTILESAQSCAYFRGYQGRVKYAEGFKALRILKGIK